MAVNRFEKPNITPIKQTYVSQHVDLPFQQYAQALRNKQVQKDQNDAKMEQGIAAILNTQAIDRDTVMGNQAELRNKRIEEYEDRVQDIVNKYNGDTSLADKEVNSLIRDINRDKTRGDLAFYQSNYDKQQAETLKMKEAVDKKLLSGFEVDPHMAVGDKQFQETGVYTPHAYSKQVSAEDILFDKIAPRVKSSGGYGFINKDKSRSAFRQNDAGDFEVLIGQNWESVSSDKAANIAKTALAGNIEYQEYKNYLINQGLDPQNAEDNAIASFTGATSFYKSKGSLKTINKPSDKNKNKKSETEIEASISTTRVNKVKENERKRNLSKFNNNENQASMFNILKPLVRGDGMETENSLTSGVIKLMNGQDKMGNYILGADGTSYEGASENDILEGISKGNIDITKALGGSASEQEKIKFTSGAEKLLMDNKKKEHAEEEIKKEFIYGTINNPEEARQRDQYLESVNNNTIGNVEKTYSNLKKSFDNSKGITDTQFEEWREDVESKATVLHKKSNPFAGYLNVIKHQNKDLLHGGITNSQAEKYLNSRIAFDNGVNDMYSNKNNEGFVEKMNEYVERVYNTRKKRTAKQTEFNDPQISQEDYDSYLLTTENPLSKDEIKEKIETKYTEVLNLPRAKDYKGVDEYGDEISLRDIMYKVDLEKGEKIVKPFVTNDKINADNLVFKGLEDGGKTVMISGVDSEGKPRTIELNDDLNLNVKFNQVNFSKATEDVDLAKEYITEGKSGFTARKHLSDDFSFFPKGYVIEYSPNEVDSNDLSYKMSTLDENQMGEETTSIRDGINMFDVTENELLALTTYSIKQRKKMNNASSVSERLKIKEESRKKLKEALALYKEKGTQDYKLYGE